jgi:hypothetical protein
LWLCSLLTSGNPSSLSMLSRCHGRGQNLDRAAPRQFTRSLLLPGYAKPAITAQMAVIAVGFYAATRCAAMI